MPQATKNYKLGPLKISVIFKMKMVGGQREKEKNHLTCEMQSNTLRNSTYIAKTDQKKFCGNMILIMTEQNKQIRTRQSGKFSFVFWYTKQCAPHQPANPIYACSFQSGRERSQLLPVGSKLGVSSNPSLFVRPSLKFPEHLILIYFWHFTLQAFQHSIKRDKAVLPNKMHLHLSEISKMWIVGPIWPTTCFYTVYELRIVFVLLNDWKKYIKGRIVFVT